MSLSGRTRTHPAEPAVPSSLDAWGQRRRGLPRGVAIGLLIAVIILAAALLTVLGAGGEPNKDPLDPNNPAPIGAKAVARVLAERGVDVEVARSQAQLLRLAVTPATTLLIANPSDLSGRTARTALRHASAAGRVVLLAPRQGLLDALKIPLQANPDAQGPTRAGCSTDFADPSDQILVGVTSYSTSSNSPALRCFATADGAYLVAVASGSELPALTLLGAPEILANKEITRADHAALALRLLGGTGELVWYVPDIADVRVGDLTTVGSVTPVAVGPGLLVLASAVLALMLWRGRRLGRLVSEPLPVVVRAVETTESRGRMYRKARDRRRAVAVLQAATRARLTAYLGLSGSADVTSLAAACAAVSGRPYAEVLHLVRDASPTDDDVLVALANQLAALEKDVYRR